MSTNEASTNQPNLPGLSRVVSAGPFLKWAGSKRQLTEQILRFAPKKFTRYVEPFVGGGAIFFALHSQNNLLNDANEELMLTYRVVQSNVQALIQLLQQMPCDEKFFYATRQKKPVELDEIERAARFIYLNRTCFNGLYRVNRDNQFNVPFGRYNNPVICDTTKLLAAHKALQATKLFSEDYASFLEREAQPEDFIYIDPPYDPISPYSDFKRYTSRQFYKGDQWQLSRLAARLTQRGCYVVISNSDTERVRDLYKDFEIHELMARRNINKDPQKRGAIKELLIVCRS